MIDGGPEDREAGESVEIERVVLDDGAELMVRCVLPSDKPHFKAGMARMSRTSRYFRFLSAKDDLTDAELRYLTEVDGHDHYAIVTYRVLEDGREEGVGVARFVRLPRMDAAEVAITVVDDWQRRGVGRLLYERLKTAARERGIRYLCSEVYDTNTGILRLLQENGENLTVRHTGRILSLEAEI